ncbi:MAG: helix-turn-helix domain-containing protein (plasmid) [Candidatus Methanoperedens sp.]|nr:MAG: helix-turn-helix domain-containing protein [Candidatus Methanoperedens sp.]
MQKEQSIKNSAYMQRILKDKVLMRLEIIRRYYAREKPPDFAAEFGLTSRNVYYILVTFEKHGWHGLTDNRGGAYNLKITEDVEIEIVKVFVGNPLLKAKDIAPILEQQNIILSTKRIDRVLEKHFLKTRNEKKYKNKCKFMNLRLSNPSRNKPLPNGGVIDSMSRISRHQKSQERV